MQLSTSTMTHSLAEEIIESQAPATTSEKNLLGDSLTNQPRLYSVDMLRGLVMVIMALDHVRDFFHTGGFDPTDLTKTSSALFMTRWITHFCAPIFVFLAGTGAFLSTTRQKTIPQLARFLLTRGLWLIILELTVIKFAWTFDYDYHYGLAALVVWALGWSMIALAGLIFLRTRAIALFGVVMMMTHNFFDDVRVESFGSLSGLWMILHQRSAFEIAPGMQFWVGYPLIPWVGVMATGYCFGNLLLLESKKRRKLLLALSISLTLAFIVLRAVKVYGDPSPWAVQEDGFFTFFSFINTTKYPPSLLYLLMTLGPAIVTLAFFDRLRESGILVHPFLVFGRVPLFYYILHLYLIHALAVVLVWLRYGFGFSSPRGYGLPVVYVVWLAVLAILYPICRWFAGIKKRRRDTWLTYL